MKDVSFKIYDGNESVKEYLKISDEAYSWDNENMCFGGNRDDDLDLLLRKRVIMKKNDEMIGYGSIMLEISMFNEDFKISLSYIVKPKYRNKGYGDYLLKYLLEYCKEKYKGHKVILSIYKENIPSITLAENNGFDFDDFDDKEIHFSKKM